MPAKAPGRSNGVSCAKSHVPWRSARPSGVCGTAVSTGQDQNVPDVRAISNYIACNAWTRSELVVLIRRGATILGQIDVDSDVPDPFTA